MNNIHYPSVRSFSHSNTIFYSNTKLSIIALFFYCSLYLFKCFTSLCIRDILHYCNKITFINSCNICSCP